MTQSLTLVALTNPKSPTNVGSVLRAAGCFGVDEVLYSGTRYDMAKKFQTDTKDMHNRIPLTHVEDFFSAPSAPLTRVCVDLIEGATALSDFVHPERALYIFGPEDGSLSQAVIDQADAVVYIPTIGCLNLAATVNIVLYDRAAKLNLVPGGDRLIQTSRDTNNKTNHGGR
ncbi:RNA methyltransferase [Reinekea sp.]|uniref:RNA methyltransferase n=1 Tax=Reinekea sp. TaxID=1970455 RepID=UPI002580BA70|nr:RNA methyltransferase [Reinekea sp.]MDO7640998.1 RNA methyltransferase [Reinekea forsetii]